MCAKCVGTEAFFRNVKYKMYFDILFIPHVLCEVKTSREKKKYLASRDASPAFIFLLHKVQQQTESRIILIFDEK